MSESKRISEATGNYERVVSEEGLRGIENDGPPDELWGSGFEKGSGVHKRIEEDLPPEKLANLPSVAEQFAIENGLLDEETGRFNEDKVLAAIEKLPREKQKDAKEALKIVLNDYIKKDYKSTGPDIRKNGKSIIRTIAPNITVENERPYYERPKPKKTEVRVTSPEDIDIWLELRQWGNVKNAYLYMDLKTWEDIDKAQQAIEEQREKLPQLEDEVKKKLLSRGIEEISEKLHLNKIGLEKKGIIRPFIFRQDKKGRDILFSEKAIYAWIDAQNKALDKERTSSDAVFSVKSKADIEGLKKIMENISKQTDSLPSTPEKDRQLKVLKKLENAYKRAEYFMETKDKKKTLATKVKTKPLPEKKKEKEKQPYKFLKDGKGRAVIGDERALFAWIEEQNRITAEDKTAGRMIFRINSHEGLREVELILDDLSKKIDNISDPKKQEKERIVYNRVAAAYRSAREYIKRISKDRVDRIKSDYKGKQPTKLKTKPTLKTENRK